MQTDVIPWADFLFFNLLPTRCHREEKWKATIAHRFFELLHRNTGKLTRLYTQNIDGRLSQKSDVF
jgi:NAD-dependent SIR2 family protein deacetylase